MPTLQYRCRRCQALQDTYVDEIDKIDSILSANITYLQMSSVSVLPREVPWHTLPLPHECQDGGRGIMELAGYTL